MEMPLPDNTIPMMTGRGPYGPIEMGGMFSVVKVRDGIDADDYSDPGWYENPPGEMAYEWTGELPQFALEQQSQDHSHTKTKLEGLNGPSSTPTKPNLQENQMKKLLLSTSLVLFASTVLSLTLVMPKWPSVCPAIRQKSTGRLM